MERHRVTVTIMASYREGRPRTSITWEHFEIKDRLRSIARCNHCHESFSYRTTVSNLKKHLRRKHEFVKVDEINENTDAADNKTDAKKALKGELWQHYEIKDESLKLATCNLCHDPFSYRSCSVLVEHLQKKHDIECLVSSDEEQSGEDSNEEKRDASPAPPTGKMTRAQRSLVWMYFKCVDPESKYFQCLICKKVLSHSTTVSNLKKHLTRKHPDVNIRERDVSCDEEQSDEDSNEEKLDASQNGIRDEERRHKVSKAWKFFDIKDPRKKIAACTVCGAKCSYRASVSNLTKHVRTQHASGPFRSSRMDKSDGEQETSDVEQNNPTPPTGKMTRALHSSVMWLYFKCVDPENKYSQCLICKKILSHATTVTNLKKHLARKHPDVKIPERDDGRKRILLSSGGELYEVETNSKLDDDESLTHDDDTQRDQTVEMDTVYLEDFDALDTTPPKKKQRLLKREKTKSPQIEISSEDEITITNKFIRRKSDSLDHFGKYLASLLRKLPSETSNTLQVDFVKQIMAVQTSDAPITAAGTYSTVTDIFDQKGEKLINNNN